MTQMVKAALGRLERVDLKQAWESEAGHFTPWLAQTENIQLLCEAIHLDLEVQSTEKPVGPFRADILCKETTTGHYVLIENQLERTDHTHLGQLMTYAAGLDAVTIVWVAKRFTDEHRAALDWLNRSTGENLNFFGLEVELWRIGASPFAPKFNVVSQPNDWLVTAKELAEKPAGELGGAALKNLEFWTQFKEYCETVGTTRWVKKPSTDHWKYHGVGRTGFGISTSNGMTGDWSTVSLVLSGNDCKPHYYLLEQQKGAIEATLGPLEWEELPGKKESRLTIRRSGLTADKSHWPELNAWFVQKATQWAKYFEPVIKGLNAAEWVDPDAPMAPLPED